MSIRNYVDGVLRQEWDDTTRLYHEYDEQGVELPGFPRDFTVEENARADSEAADSAAEAALAAQRAAVKLIVTDLKAEKDRLDVVLAKTPAQITGGDTKDVARASKRIADAAIDIARLLAE